MGEATCPKCGYVSPGRSECPVCGTPLRQQVGPQPRVKTGVDRGTPIAEVAKRATLRGKLSAQLDRAVEREEKAPMSEDEHYRRKVIAGAVIGAIIGAVAAIAVSASVEEVLGATGTCAVTGLLISGGVTW